MNETSRETNAVSLGSEPMRGNGVSRLVTDSARRAEETVSSHPYFTAGVLAGIGIAACGVFMIRARRRRGLIEQLMHWF
jgi:ElaB/YqjD/DUF883 family membrane-anchored ribosome-binding protein